MTRDPPSQTYRVLPAGATDGALRLLDLESYEPIEVAPSGGSTTDRIDGLRPGYLIEGTVSWPSDRAALDAFSVTDPTLYTFARGVTGLFEAALDTWAGAADSGEGINSRVTYSNDAEPNGALYTFAEQPGERDVFAEFRTGKRPLEPLLERIETDPPYEAFIFDPASHPFVLVYIVLQKGSVLADTVRDTYDCPRPTEPLLEDSDDVSMPGQSTGHEDSGPGNLDRS